jgi:anoctamin-1
MSCSTNSLDTKIICEFRRLKSFRRKIPCVPFSNRFDTERDDFFNQTIRIAVVQFILERQRFNEDYDNANCFGIAKLLEDGVYQAAYPLHDSNLADDYGKGQRALLYTEWAALKKWYRYQPIDTIKDYFGVQIALYFAWLGFYTHMLIPASIMGIICFMYGLVTLFSNQISEDICNDNKTIVMCPQVSNNEYYWKVKLAIRLSFSV